MSSISVSPEQFQDVLTAYLLDLLVNENPTDNVEFDVVLKKMKNAGLKSNLLTMFLDMPGQSRILYKMIKPVLMKDTIGKSYINIINSDDQVRRSKNDNR